MAAKGEETELSMIPTKAPSIAVTDAGAGLESPSSSNPSQSSSGLSSSPSACGMPSPATSVTSEDIADEAVCRARAFSQSADSSTLVPTVANSATSTSPPPSPGSNAFPRRPESKWKRFMPGNNAQTFLGVGVCALTVVTVVYSYRADVNQRYQNWLNFLQMCRGEGFTVPNCKPWRGYSIPAPPFSFKPMFATKPNMPSSSEKFTGATSSSRGKFFTSPDQSSESVNESNVGLNWRSTVLSIAVVVAGVSLATWFAWLLWKRRSTRPRVSDQSIARSDLTSATVGYHTTGMEQPEETTLRKRYRAFVTAETAINALKSANSSQTTITDRRSSNPWSRHSSLSGSNPSIFNEAIFYEHDRGHEDKYARWREISHHGSSMATLNSMASTLHPLSSPSTARRTSPTTIEEEHEAEEEQLRHMSKVQRWFTPRRVTISEHPFPELQAGDTKGAFAFIGASSATTGGGKLMSRCPVEVSLQPKNLPDSWMPSAPQDLS